MAHAPPQCVAVGASDMKLRGRWLFWLLMA